MLLQQHNLSRVRAVKVGLGQSGRDGNGNSAACISFPTAISRPLPVVDLCSHRLPSRRKAPRSRPNFSCPTVCSVVPIPCRRSHTAYPFPQLVIEADIPILFTTGCITSPSHDYGCNWIMQLWMSSCSSSILLYRMYRRFFVRSSFFPLPSCVLFSAVSRFSNTLVRA